MKNFGNMMKQVQEMQSKMQDMQAKFEALEIEGSSGAGMVTVTLSGKGVMRGIKIDPSILSGDDAEMVEDLIVAAHNDAKMKLEERQAEEMKDVTGGLPLPPGFKMPF